MADLEITVKYKSLPARATFLFCMFTLPLWGVLSPFAVAFLFIGNLYTFLQRGQAMNFADMIHFGACFSLVAILGGIVTVMSSDTQICLSKLGISLPAFLAPTLGFRKQIPWSAIDNVQVIGEQDKGRIRFKGPSTDVSLNLSSIPKDQLEQLLLAVQLWGGDCERNPALLELHEKLQGNEEKLSYTAMWEEELARRFATTAFVPLEPGTTLYSDKLKVVRQLSFGGPSWPYISARKKIKIWLS